MENTKMEIQTKPWTWEIVNGDYEKKWKTPAEEIYYLINRWHEEGKDSVLDLGCGIGRHSILFSQAGFKTYAMDLSENAIDRAKEWANTCGLNIDFQVGDMTNLPYNNETMDAIFAYNVISHTDTRGVIEVINNINRLLKKDGEAYLTFGSKNSWGFKKNWPIVDENTKIRIDDGPDNNVPHFYADPELIFKLFSEFNILDLKQIQKIEKNSDGIKTHEHYHVLVKKR